MGGTTTQPICSCGCGCSNNAPEANAVCTLCMNGYHVYNR